MKGLPTNPGNLPGGYFMFLKSKGGNAPLLFLPRYLPKPKDKGTLEPLGDTRMYPDIS